MEEYCKRKRNRSISTPLGTSWPTCHATLPLLIPQTGFKNSLILVRLTKSGTLDNPCLTSLRCAGPLPTRPSSHPLNRRRLSPVSPRLAQPASWRCRPPFCGHFHPPTCPPRRSPSSAPPPRQTPRQPAAALSVAPVAVAAGAPLSPPPPSPPLLAPPPAARRGGTGSGSGAPRPPDADGAACAWRGARDPRCAVSAAARHPLPTLPLPLCPLTTTTRKERE